MKNTKLDWTKPELIKLGTLKDVAGGAVAGIDSGGKGNKFKAIS